MLSYKYCSWHRRMYFVHADKQGYAVLIGQSSFFTINGVALNTKRLGTRIFVFRRYRY